MYCTCCLNGAGYNDFTGGKSISRALDGVGSKNQDFSDPEMSTSKVSAIWASKSWGFQGSSLPMAQVMDLPPSKSFSPIATQKSRYIGNFMYMSFAAGVWCGQIHFEGPFTPSPLSGIFSNFPRNTKDVKIQTYLEFHVDGLPRTPPPP